jgi:MoaA/NifB/PqqE/SkfB family radical SAM enzyme
VSRPLSGLTIDIELTNRCNAACSFCPRDAMPEQGLMRHDVFEQSLVRAAEFQGLARTLPIPVELTVVFCGTGEPLVHPRAAEYVRRVRDAGLTCEISTNGSLLSRDRALALLDAGLDWINFNVSDLGADYERVYGLPFAATRDNVEQFIALALGRCVVCMIVVDHRRDEARLREVEAYWRSRGVDHVFRYGLVNRGGSLRRADVALPPPGPDERREEPEPRLICPAPFVHLFVGWDGCYYLCSQDWQKEVPFGSVFETSFAEITAAKLSRVSSRKPICVRCTLDPVNLLRRRRRVADPTLSPPLGTSLEKLVLNDAVAKELARQVADTARRVSPALAS